MKNWLRNTLIAGSLLAGAKGFSQNAKEDVGEYLSDSNNWKTYEVSQGIKQPEYCDSNLVNFLDAAKWKDYEVHEGLKQPEYCSKDSTKKQELPSFKEAKEKLGIKYITEIKNLGHGYITSKPEYGTFNKNYNDLRTLEGLNSGNVKLNYNGKRGLVKGTLSGDVSEKVLDEVDINDDYIITKKEISSSMKKEYEEAFKEYASKKLNAPRDSIVKVGNGYVTSKNLESLLTATGKLYERMAGEPFENLYDIMSEEDAVLTEEEVLSVAKAMKKYLDHE